MKIASVSLKDFRAYESASMVLDTPLTIIRGANHQGKFDADNGAGMEF